MTCADLFRMLVLHQTLATFILLFAAAVVGSSVTVLYFNFRYRRGILWQKREDEQAQAFKDTEGKTWRR